MPPSRAHHKTLQHQRANLRGLRRDAVGYRAGRAVSRFLFVSPPLAGHVNPTAALGRELAARGHEVAWAGSELSLRPLLGPDVRIYPTGSPGPPRQAARGYAAVRSLWEEFIVPYAKFTAKAVDKTVIAYQPDVVISDEHTPTGAFTAYRHGVPWATLAT